MSRSVGSDGESGMRSSVMEYRVTGCVRVWLSHWKGREARLFKKVNL